MFSGPFEFIIHPMELGLIWLVLHVGSAGIGIILFTIFVRLVLAPLQIVQLRNARVMQKLAPQIKEIQKKHGKDRVTAQQEVMAVYKEHNANPALGCLPMLVQFPILIGLFYALMHLGTSPVGYPGHIDWAKQICNNQHVHNWAQWLQSCYAVNGATGTTQQIFNLFHAQFLWLSRGLGQPDPLYILPLLAGATQWIQSRMLLVQSQDPQQQAMNTMTNFFPLMIIFFAWHYASGLSLYWVTSTVIGILIQYPITGIGLLKSGFGGGGGLGSLAQLFAPPAPAATSKNGRSSNQRPAKTVRETPTPEALGDQPLPAVEVDGKSNGTGNGQVARPRKKANRARGGRGGRRG